MDLRFYARGKGVPLWRVAEAYGIHENTLLQRLRKQYSKEDAKEFMRIVDKLSRKE
ncbi:MAG: hypothetical protein GX562_07675 [Coriobacteriaceae bacterium]|nr:hypothetical protein [Coriobacteriaceae bacterium]